MTDISQVRDGGGVSSSAIAVRHVEVRHGGHTVLGPIDLDIELGETVALLGPNGSGKTSLLRVLAGISSPDAGVVHLGNRPLSQIRARDRARLIASVAQDEHTELPFTARDVLLLGRAAGIPDWRPYRRNDHEFIQELAERWEIADLLDRSLPDMSGGERRRVLIARAFAQETDVLLLDEPTNHLDLRHQHDLLAHLSDTPSTSIVALHDIDLALAYCTRLILLDHGRVVVDGPPSDSLTAEIVERVYRVEAQTALVAGRPRIIVGR